MNYIFTVATNIYIQFLEYQAKTYQHLFPQEDKMFIWFVDNVDNAQQIANKFPEFNISIERIDNLVYPFNTYFKFNYIENWCNRNGINDTDMIMFFDADTVFVAHPDPELLYKNVTSHNCTLTFDPTNNHQGNIFWQYEDGPCSVSYEYMSENYIQASFIICKYSFFKVLMKDYNYYVRDYSIKKKLPVMFDQTILNYLASIDTDNNFYLDNFNLNVANRVYTVNGVENISWQVQFKTPGKWFGWFEGERTLQPYELGNNFFFIQKFNQHIKAKNKLGNIYK